jgi:uncharacterized protein
MTTTKRPTKRPKPLHRPPKRLTLADTMITKAIAGGQVRTWNTKAAPLNAPRMFRFTVSTGEYDRENDRIPPSGWSLEAFTRNPVVLFGHDARQPPVARANRVWVERGALRADIEFPPPGVYGFADTVHDLVKAGFLNTTSVGFKGGPRVRNERGGFDWQAPVELLEVSIVSLPANPSALIEGRTATAAMRKWLATKPDREIVLRVKDDTVIRIKDDPAPKFQVDPATLAAGLAVTMRSTLESPAFKAQLAHIIDRRVAAELRALRGRLA